jgi:hypothetical protein
MLEINITWRTTQGNLSPPGNSFCQTTVSSLKLLSGAKLKFGQVLWADLNGAVTYEVG